MRKRKGRSEIRGGWYRTSVGSEGEGMEGRHGNARKKAAKGRLTYSAFVDAFWGLPPRVTRFYKALFRDSISIGDIMPLKVNRLKVIELQTSLYLKSRHRNSTYFELCQLPLVLPPRAVHF